MKVHSERSGFFLSIQVQNVMNTVPDYGYWYAINKTYYI